MTFDLLIQNQLLMAQAMDALALLVSNSTGYALTPVAFADLPTPERGMLACVNNSTVNAWGTVIAGGGGFTVLAFYNGTNWTVAGV